MTINDIMKFIESEYNIMSSIHCEICGGDFIATGGKIVIIDDAPFNVCSCKCEHCGHKRDFTFAAPFISTLSNEEIKKRLN